ncbi:protein TIFY 8-like [Bidens hawaiensis]|uniref:protein TIFY 8-like n=1 Tax=Bidens hawaiensis TaxID=980011 RepID=UPI00404B311A
MAASLLNIMADNSNNNNINININYNVTDDVKPTVLHDFLGRGCAPAAGGGSSPSASVSGGGRGGGLVSTTSDLGSERQPGTFFEGVPYFSQKPDFSGSKIRYSGSKRSNSDLGFLPPTREVIPQLRPDFPETSHLMKMLRNVGGERPRWPHEDEPFMGMHQMRPTSSSHMVQQQPTNASKWDRAIPVNVGPVLQYPARTAQVALPYSYQPASSNRFKDSNAGSPLMSQSAADEGSRTGIKGSGILSSANVGGTVGEPSSSKLKSLISNNEPGSSNPPTHQGPSSVSRQMTIFYGGQAHVFDDVHPNKAEAIMTLAGSNGGSWSTSFLPNSSLKPSGGEPVSLSGGQGSLSMKDARGFGIEEKSDEKQ